MTRTSSIGWKVKKMQDSRWKQVIWTKSEDDSTGIWSACSYKVSSGMKRDKSSMEFALTPHEYNRKKGNYTKTSGVVTYTVHVFLDNLEKAKTGG